jgi:hypothetical protein
VSSIRVPDAVASTWSILLSSPSGEWLLECTLVLVHFVPTKGSMTECKRREMQNFLLSHKSGQNYAVSVPNGGNRVSSVTDNEMRPVVCRNSPQIRSWPSDHPKWKSARVTHVSLCGTNVVRQRVAAGVNTNSLVLTGSDQATRSGLFERAEPSQAMGGRALM